ncbi:DegT/DnrJ/EryC1/StrS family aminotransferase [Flavobacterium aurantiibacter]|uniref:Pyridoxal phosphate-dependent aminotransferase n=1 Tax=Flavobacterium aurantiibacter TaxID=2023067 RepID=A0A255ZRC0_9FLAO|nr:aminotransferase class I/II-fold pyridoxal phosphate-dependent enzyme [Flavobacterium aurantiibacter]OYQ43939.1 pyridoxal phosphate-dependent aminotransferase [Flavobacterium aurantiibacter]
MSLQKIWLSSPHMGGSELSYIHQAFDTNWVAPLGPNVEAFEQQLESFIGSEKFVAALSSGTAALHLALVLLGVTHGDEVLCQSLTFSASANPIIYQGAKPIFIDSENETWNICPIALEEAILDRIKLGKKPKAIIAVHLYGVPYLVERVAEISRKYQIPVIEDSAEALGSTYKGRHCGTFGDYGALSFNGNKIITTSGGGALVANSPKEKSDIVFYATQSRDQAPHYQHSKIGFNYRMSNICAGIGRGQMEVLDSHIAKRRAMNAFYKDCFKDIPGVEVFQADETVSVPNYWLSAIQIDPKRTDGKTREDLRLFFESLNIESRPIWKPMHLQPFFENDPFYGGTVAADLFENGLCLPSGSNLHDSDRDRISTAISSFFNS